MSEKATVRQQSSENNSVSSSEWDMANDVFVSGYDDTPLGDSLAPGNRDPAQPDLDRHLPLLRGDSHRLSEDGMMLGLTGEEYSATSYLDIEPDFTERDANVTAKKRIRSNSSRHRGEIVTELGPEEVRWFYKEDKRTWKPFVGHDSLKIELVYLRFCEQNSDKVKRLDLSGADGKEAAEPVAVEPDLDVEAVCVRGGLYEVDIREKECYPVYWNRELVCFTTLYSASS